MCHKLICTRTDRVQIAKMLLCPSFTGDVGHITENDCFVISDRLKELIKYKGLQVNKALLYMFNGKLP